MYFLYQMRFMIKPYSSGLYVNILGDDINTQNIQNKVWLKDAALKETVFMLLVQGPINDPLWIF